MSDNEWVDLGEEQVGYSKEDVYPHYAVQVKSNGREVYRQGVGTNLASALVSLDVLQRKDRRPEDEEWTYELLEIYKVLRRYEKVRKWVGDA